MKNLKSENFKFFSFWSQNSYCYFLKWKSVKKFEFIGVAIIFETFIIPVYGIIFVYFLVVFLRATVHI